MSRNNRIQLIISRKNIHLFGLKLFFALLFVFALSSKNDISAQNIADTKVSLNVANITVSAALETLYKQHNIKLAFSSTELNKFFIEKYSVVDKSLSEIITDLLKGTGYLHKTIGNQIVIFKDNSIPDNKADRYESPAPKKKNIKSGFNDTIYITDTVTVIKKEEIIRMDTLIKVDTLHVIDTVVVYKQKPMKMKLKDLSGHFFAADYSHDKKFSARLSYSQQYCTISLKSMASMYDEYNSLFDNAINNYSFKNFQVDMEGGYTYKNWDFTVGISYNTMQHKFSFSEELWNEPSLVIDTIDSYYIINLTSLDTSYYYIFDTLTIPASSFTYNTHDINRLSFIGLNLNAAYTFYHSERVKVYLKAGVGIDFIVKAEGSYIINSAENKVREIDIESFHSNRFTYLLGIGTRFALTESFDVVPEIYYKHYCNSIVKSDKIDTKVNCIGIKLGIHYYF